MNLTMKSLICSILLFVFIAPRAGAVIKEGQLECPVIRPIAQGFLAHHIDARKLDLEHEGRTIERFIKMLDPQKFYLLQSDAMEIRGLLRGIFKNLGEDCAPIEKSYAILTKRMTRALEYAKKALGNDFKFQEDTEITINPDLRKFAADEKEFETQLSKYFQFQISNYLASDTKLPEAKKQLIHRYELLTKRQNELKREEVYALFLDAYASGLDAHSSYLSRDVLEDFEIQMRLSLEGIGAALAWEDGYTTVENLIPGGSAERSGELKPKDKIIAVAQGSGAFEQVIDMPLRDVVKLIRGKKGTQVRLTVLRQEKNSSSRLVIALVRDRIKLEDEAARLVFTKRKVGNRELKLAVLDLPSFYGDLQKKSRSCYEDVRKKLEEAVKAKVDGIVFDLSKNGGGLLTEAVRIGGLFIKRGNIVATENSREKVDMLADEDDAIVYNGPLVVHTSRMSASASEIVAGALQDYKRAVIVGSDHTFGKGTVQAMMNLPSDFGAIKVTTGMFFVPGGHSTQYRGVPADVPLPSVLATKDYGEEALDYSLPAKARAPFLSADANVPGNVGWKPVSPETIAKLQKLSSARVEKDSEFKKIREELADIEKKKGVIRLSDSLKKQREEKADPKAKHAKNKPGRRGKRQDEEEYLKNPAINESLSVLADMIEAG